MSPRLFRTLSIGITFLLIQACSHPIEIEGKGDVKSESGSRNCSLEEFSAGSDNCTKNYVVWDYQETYYAKPHTGWYFARWVNYCTTEPVPRCSFSIPRETVQQYWFQTMPPLKAVFVTQCGDKLMAGIEQCDDGNVIDGDGCEATCTLTPDADGDGVPDVTDNCLAVANSNQADFNNDGEGDACDDSDGDGTLDISDTCPLNPNNPCTQITSADIVVADGKEWAQVGLFSGLSWNQINAVCPWGACSAGGILNGRDMTGWTWASIGNLVSLFNSYGIQPPLSTSTLGWSEVNSAWAPAFFNAGWRTNNIGESSGRYTIGWSMDAWSNPAYGCTPWVHDMLPGYNDTFVLCGFPAPKANAYVGAWMFRVP